MQISRVLKHLGNPTNTHSSSHRVCKFLLKCQHSSDLNAKFIIHSLTKYKHILANRLGYSVDFMLCKSQQANLFRRNFANNWSTRTWDAF